MSTDSSQPNFSELKLLRSLTNSAAELNQLPSFALRIQAFESPLLRYLELLKRWNERMDLVSPASDEMLISRHLIDSALAWCLIENQGFVVESGVIDIGSGAGLPGIVIGILSPNRSVMLLEPREKRGLFLSEVIRVLGLKNVEVVRDRLENLPIERLSENPLWITRATGMWPEIVKLAERVSTDKSAITCMEFRSGEGGESNSQKSESISSYVLPPDRAKRSVAVRLAKPVTN